MSKFYIKTSEDNFVPVDFEQVFTKDWDNKMVWVRMGTDDLPATEDEMAMAQEMLDSATVLELIKNVSFVITSYALDFQILAGLEDLKRQTVAVRVTGDDDLSKLGGLQKNAKDQLRESVKKVVVLPAPITVDEYQEVMKIKRRCDLRKSRRGR